MSDPALLAEAYKRNILPPDIKASYEEALRRGLVQGDAAPEPQGGRQASAADLAASAMTFGLTNDVSGAVRALGPMARFVGNKMGFDVPYKEGEIGDAYRGGRDAAIKGQAAYRDANPVTAFGADVVGSLANPAARLALPAPGASMAQKALQGAKIGATTGAAYGFGTAPGDLWDRAEGAAAGGLVGGAVGAAAPPLIEGASSSLRYLADQTIGRMGATNQQSVGARKVAEALIRDGYTPDQAAAKLAQMGPDAIMADLGQNTRNLAGAISRVPGEGAGNLTARVTARQEGVRDANNVLTGGQQGRISSVLDDVTPERLRGTTDAIAQRRAADAAPKYAEAFAQPIDQSPRLKQFLDDPIAKRGLAKGLEIQRLEALAEGRSFNPTELAVVDFNAAGDPILGGVPNMRTYDAVKRGLDAIIQDETNLAGKVSERGRAVLQVKNSMLKELDKANPAYAEARAAFSGPSQLIDAAKLGNSFMSKATFANADDLAAKLKNMSPDELHSVRIGAVQALRDKMEGLVSRADATKALMDMPGMENKIRLVFGDDAVFKRYIGMLKNERQMFDTYVELTKGSQTAARQQANADLARDPGSKAQAVMDIASSPLNPMSYLRAGMRLASDAKTRAAIPEPVRNQMAAMLMGQNAQAINRPMQLSMSNEAMRNALARGLLSGGTGAMVPSLLAPPMQPGLLGR